MFSLYNASWRYDCTSCIFANQLLDQNIFYKELLIICCLSFIVSDCVRSRLYCFVSYGSKTASEIDKAELSLSWLLCVNRTMCACSPSTAHTPSGEAAGAPLPSGLYLTSPSGLYLVSPGGLSLTSAWQRGLAGQSPSLFSPVVIVLTAHFLLLQVQRNSETKGNEWRGQESRRERECSYTSVKVLTNCRGILDQTSADSLSHQPFCGIDMKQEHNRK